MNSVNEDLTDLVRRFDGIKATVVGDVMLDVYLSGTTRRLCQEAPVPIVDLQDQRSTPGGAANVALNLRELGAEVTLLSILGDDEAGRELGVLLWNRGVKTSQLLWSRHRRTLVKRRITSDGQLIARLDEGTADPVISEEEDWLIPAMRRAVESCDAVIVSDYGYGVLTERIIAALADCVIDAPIPVVIDSKDLPRFRRVRPTAVKPNYGQLLGLLAGLAPCEEGTRWKGLQQHGQRLREATGAAIVAATLDREGALIFPPNGTPHRTYSQPAPQSHAAGAGDTFLAALALSLAVRATPQQAGDLATAAAAVVVAKRETATCSQAELISQLQGGAPSGKFSALAPVLEMYRRRGRRIVMTNGCFDILHPGHITYLQQAKSLGDVLIVGVNTDDTIRRLKGPDRPINTLEDRLKVLAALSCIDHLVAFEEDTPHRLIEAVRPDVFVKGGDYTRDTLPEASLVEELGGSVKILPFLDGRSTTKIISRIWAGHAAMESDDVLEPAGEAR